MNATPCLDDIDPDFKYSDSNSSHQWLLNYPNSLKPDPRTLKISSKNEDFGEPQKLSFSTKGKRKKLLEKFFRQEISKEIIGKFQEENVIIEPYETDYTEHYKNPDDMPLPGETCSKNQKLQRLGEINSCPSELSKINKLEELKSKYPLYMSMPLTYFSQKAGKQNFGLKTTISKRPEENYDNIEY